MTKDAISVAAASTQSNVKPACIPLPNCAIEIALPERENEKLAAGRVIGNKPNRSQAVTVGQFADMAGVSLRTARYWQKAGILPRRHRVSHKYVWHIDDVKTWLETSRQDEARR